MITLTIRTDKPEAEVGIFDDGVQVAYVRWHAHRALAETLHQMINQALQEAKIELNHLNGIVVFQGPGSFTGLRIGISVANALAYSLQIPIIASSGDTWVQDGISAMRNGEDHRIALPEYGAPVHITQQKK